jgi:hypothetical protein
VRTLEAIGRRSGDQLVLVQLRSSPVGVVAPGHVHDPQVGGVAAGTLADDAATVGRDRGQQVAGAGRAGVSRRALRPSGRAISRCPVVKLGGRGAKRQEWLGRSSGRTSEALALGRLKYLHR